MKKISLIVLVVMFALCAVAIADQNVMFQWDANNPAPDGYRLFQRDQSGAYDYTAPIWQGTELTHSVTLPNGAYGFVLRAFVGNAESGDSNEVLYTVEDVPAPILIPARPKSFTIVFE